MKKFFILVSIFCFMSFQNAHALSIALGIIEGVDKKELQASTKIDGTAILIAAFAGDWLAFYGVVTVSSLTAAIYDLIKHPATKKMVDNYYNTGRADPVLAEIIERAESINPAMSEQDIVDTLNILINSDI